MRKSILSAFAALLLFGACQKNSSSKNEEPADESSTISQRACATSEVVETQMAADPSIKLRMNEIEAFTKRIIGRKDFRTMAGTTINIPVVVHVLYKTAQENISQAQIQSQIDVLNNDFNKQNSDFGKTPREFAGLVADANISFTLDRVIRKPSNKKSWQPNDAMKKSSQGGSDAIDPANYLNIWVCNVGQKILGYAYYPGTSPAAVDGVVVLYSAFGSTGTLIPKYNLGRTATHEVGHWMNLRHIWGESTCGTDAVDDTPQHNTSNFGCPSYPHYSTCTGTPLEMTMNYMDYTDDACMYMFTHGQSDRMAAVFAAGGPREGFTN